MPMPPQTTAHTTHVPAGLAINEAMRPELVPFGQSNLACTNVRQTQLGDLDTRNGFAAFANVLTDGTTPTAGYKVLADKGAAVRICDGTAQVYDTKGQAWKSLGRVPDCAVAEVDLPSMGVSSTLEDQAYCNGYICAGWNANAAATYAFYGIVNATTWATVRAPEQIVASSNVAATLVGTYGNYFVAVVADAGGTIKAWYLDTTSATTIAAGWVSIGTIAADYATFTFNGFAMQSLADRIAVFYVNTLGGTNRATVKTFNIAGVITSATVNTGSVTPLATEVMGSIADTLWLSWNENLNVRVMGVDGTSLATTATVATLVTVITSASTIGMAQSATTGRGRLLVTDGLTMIARDFSVSAGVTTGGAAAVTIPSATPAGRPTQYLGRYYVPVFANQTATLAQNDQKTCILVDFTSNTTSVRPVANLAPGLAVVSTYHKGQTARGAVASKLYFGFNITRSTVANASALAEYDFASARRWQACPFGNSTFLSGGLLSYLDGVRVAEASFLARPTLPTMSYAGTGISAATGWRYVCVYEEVDSDGNWHVSGLSAPSASTGVVANKTVTVTTAPLSVSARINTTSAQASSVRVAFYRTLDGGNAPYYRLGTTVNDTTATTVTFADTVADATLAANAKLYSQPGVLGTAQDRRPPPGLGLLVSYNGVLVGASGSDVWYSGQNVSGEGAWFNPVFQIPVPGDGDITALWVMDGTLFVAKRREIYAIAGEAPSDNGASGGLGLPRRLAVDVGCIEPRSVCVTSLGTFFQSDRGIEILTRAQTVAWIGQNVQTALMTYPVVTSATVEPVACVVYIEVAASQSAGLVTGAGRTLVFDLSIKDWVSEDVRTSSTGAAAAPSQSACMIYTGSAYRYAWITAAGIVHYEDPTTHLDANGSFIAPSFETAWLKHGLQQEQRVWSGTILFQQITAAGLQIECAYDYAPYAGGADTRVWSEAETLGRRQLEWRPKPRGEAMKFRVTATAPAVLGTGQAFTFIGVSFDLAPKQGATKGVVRLDPTVRK